MDTDEERAQLHKRLAELDEADQTGIEDAMDEVIEEVKEVAKESDETTAEVHETVKDAAAEIAEDTGASEDDVYDRIMSRLESEGRLVAKDTPGKAIVEPVAEPVVAVVADVTEEPARAADEIHPRSEHPYFKKRRIMGREW